MHDYIIISEGTLPGTISIRAFGEQYNATLKPTEDDEGPDYTTAIPPPLKDYGQKAVEEIRTSISEYFHKQGLSVEAA